MSYVLACKSAGITFETFSQWLKKGQEDGAEEKFIVFHDRVKAAESECVRGCLERIRQAAENGDSFNDRWLLAVRYKEDYGSKQEIKADVTGSIKIILETEDFSENREE